MRVMLLKRWLVGAPMPLAQARHERLGKRVALAVFSSDAMSSVAYATEEILLVETIHAYPSGGGSYIVARANLGTAPGLVAAAALLVDYVLTVAVSVAAGVAAITSAVPELASHTVVLGVVFVAGVFVSFTLAQSGMVRHWLRERSSGWRWRMVINGVGATATTIVTVVIAVTKFAHGAWIVVLVIPALVATFVMMRRHYDEVARDLSLESMGSPPEFQHTVLVLVGDVHRGVVRSVQYARTLASTATVRGCT